jgi:hypothetical protein
MSRNSTYTLTGNTYPHRKAIADIGGVWDASRKAWVVEAGTMRQRVQQGCVLHELRSKGVKIEESRP